MSDVVVSFIGRGRLSADPSGRRYLQTIYRFPDGSEEEAAFFGAAFLRWLEKRDFRLQRWIVMGTSQSMWDALYEALPFEARERLLEESLDLWQKVFEAKERGEADQEIVNRWEAALRRYLPNLDLRLRVVGAANSEESQMRMWEELMRAVDEGDRVLLDITHGFRHQPALTAFMLVLLKWLKNIEGFELYYGAFEMAKEGDPCPVLRLSTCNLLTQVAEALAIFRTTGNFAQLAEVLPLDEQGKKGVKGVAYADEINQQARSAAKEVLRSLDNLSVDPIKGPVVEVLKDCLKWAEGQGLPQRMAEKARFALEHGQFLKAIVLLYEALLVAGCQLYQTGDPMTWEARKRAFQRLKRELPSEKVEVLRKVEDLRNTVVHGGRGQEREVQQALNSPEAFRQIFKEGEALLKELLAGEVLGRSCFSPEDE